MPIVPSRPAPPSPRAIRPVRERFSLAALRALTLLPPLAGRAHRRIGLLHARAGRGAEAIASLAAALARGLTPGADVHHQLGQALLAAGRPDAAAGHFRQAIAADPTAYWSEQGLGQALLSAGRAGEAEAALRRGLTICPGHAWLSFHLARMLVGQGRYAEALDLIIDAGMAATDEPPTVVLSIPDYLQPDMATAARIAALIRIVERFPSNCDFVLLLGRLLLIGGDTAAATRRLCDFGRRQWAQREQGRHGPADPAGPAPAFLIIGQGKAGTTALYAYLCRHPLVLPAITKEIRYWSDAPAAGLEWYRAHFPPIPAASGLITGDASPQYLIGSAVPAAVARDFPRVKLIVLLRDPVSRAYSSYRMFQRDGRDQRTWEEVLEQEMAETPVCPLSPEALPATTDNRGPRDYLLRSAALPFLRRWLQHFPPEQFLILKHAHLRRDAAATVRRVYRFLDLPDFVPDCAERHNVGNYQPMAPETRRRLEDWFAPHQQALAAFLTEHFA